MLKFLKIVCVCFLHVINNFKSQLENIDEYQTVLEVRENKLTKCMLHFHEFMNFFLTSIHYWHTMVEEAWMNPKKWPTPTPNG
jgi:hypothetical protein